MILCQRVRNICRCRGFDAYRFDIKTKINKLDGVLALIYYMYYSFFIYVFGLVIFKTEFFKKFTIYFTNEHLYKLIIYIPVSLLSISPIFIILWYRKQNLDTIGIKFNRLFQSLLIGFIGSLPFILPSIIGLFNQNKQLLYNFTDTVWIFMYFFICIAFTEEIAFRGFIQTRIEGIIKNKWVSILFVGIMFGLMHIPFQMIQANMSFIEFVSYDKYHLIITALIHIYLVYLYTRNNNILSSTITHTLIDFIPSIIN